MWKLNNILRGDLTIENLVWAKLWLAKNAYKLEPNQFAEVQRAAEHGERALAERLIQKYRSLIRTKELDCLLQIPERMICKCQLNFLPATIRNHKNPCSQIIKLVSEYNITEELQGMLTGSLLGIPGFEAGDICPGPVKTVERSMEKINEYYEEDEWRDHDVASTDMKKEVPERWINFHNQLKLYSLEDRKQNYAFCINDYCRVSIECRDVKTMVRIFNRLIDLKFVEVVAVKNLFRLEARINESSQYRDLKVLMAVPFDIVNEAVKGEHFVLIVEVQILMREWLFVKKLNSLHYKIGRARSGRALSRDCNKYLERYKKKSRKDEAEAIVRSGIQMPLAQPLLEIRRE